MVWYDVVCVVVVCVVVCDSESTRGETECTDILEGVEVLNISFYPTTIASTKLTHS